MFDYRDAILGAAGSGGHYDPFTNSMSFGSRCIPDEFPYLNYVDIRESDIDPLAVLLEEFAHRFQFQTTHFGFLYRLACMIQAQKALEVLTWLGASSTRHLQVPWLTAKPTDDGIRNMIDDLRALEDAKRLIMGSDLDGKNALTRATDCFPKVIELVERYSPIRLGNLDTFCGFERFYDCSGRSKITETTKAIVESHASAFAFEFIRRHAPKGLRSTIEQYIKKNRRSFYRDVEDIARAIDKSVTLDLGAVLRLGDYSMNGKLVDIRTIPPPEDYVENAIPYYRYCLLLKRFRDIRKAGQTLGYDKLSLEQQVESAIYMYGDDRGTLKDLGIDKKKESESRTIQLQQEISKILSWLGEQETNKPLPDGAKLIRWEIACSSVTFMRGVFSFPPDARKFDPSVPGLVTLCRICDLPSIEHTHGFEIFRCEPRDLDDYFLAFRANVHSIGTITKRLIGWDLKSVMDSSTKLESIGLPGLTKLMASLGFTLSQIS